MAGKKREKGTDGEVQHAEEWLDHAMEMTATEKQRTGGENGNCLRNLESWNLENNWKRKGPNEESTTARCGLAEQGDCDRKQPGGEDRSREETRLGGLR